MTPSNLASMTTVNEHPGWTRTLGSEGGLVFDIFPDDNANPVAVTRSGLFHSRDDGQSWSPLETPPLALTLRHSGQWWLGTDFGLFVADRLDGSWRPALTGQSITDLLVDPASDLVLAVSETDGLLRSDDGGESWEDANAGLSDTDIAALVWSPDYERDHTLFLATQSGLYRSRNGGRAWRELPDAPTGVQMMTVSGNCLLVLNDIGDGHISDDLGRNWSPVLPAITIRGFSNGPDDHLLVLGDSGLVILDGTGETVQTLPLPDDAVCAFQTADSMLIGTASRGVLRRPVNSDTWEAASTGLNAVSRTRIIATGTSHFFTTSNSGAVMQSVDSARTWIERSDIPLDGLLDLALHIDQTSIVCCNADSAGAVRERWEILPVNNPVAVAWIGDQPAVLTAAGQFSCGDLQIQIMPPRFALIGGRLYPANDQSGVIWAVVQTDRDGAFVLRSGDSGAHWYPQLQTDTPRPLSLVLAGKHEMGQRVILAAGHELYDLPGAPAPIWTGESELIISAGALAADGSVLLATNRGLWTISPDFTAAVPVAGSPSPLLDVAANADGTICVVARNGEIWRLD